MQQAGNMIKADTGKENVHICYPLDCIPSPRPPPIFVRRDCNRRGRAPFSDNVSHQQGHCAALTLGWDDPRRMVLE